MYRITLLFSLVLLLNSLGSLPAQTKKEDKKDPVPEILLVPQLGADLGKTTQLTIRGLRFDNVTEIRIQEPKSSSKLLGKAKKIAVPNMMEVSRVGDCEIEVEVTLPKELPSQSITFTLLNSSGESKPHPLIVNSELPRTQEKEPNDGFRQAQLVELPSIIEGDIKQPQDVDVYQFVGKSGEEVTFKVQAREFGSPLEAMLYLYDSSGRLITTSETNRENGDPILKVKLPHDDTYFLSLLDANDQGASIFVYRLNLLKKP
jgi:hypothetical protein